MKLAGVSDRSLTLKATFVKSFVADTKFYFDDLCKLQSLHESGNQLSCIINSTYSVQVFQHWGKALGGHYQNGALGITSSAPLFW
jgi:hypothetical protein